MRLDHFCGTTFIPLTQGMWMLFRNGGPSLSQKQSGEALGDLIVYFTRGWLVSDELRGDISSDGRRKYGERFQLWTSPSGSYIMTYPAQNGARSYCEGYNDATRSIRKD